MIIKKPPRIVLLAALLAIETALAVSLRRLGWFGTGGAIRWIACAVLAALPLVLAVTLVLRRRLRFSLQAMLTAVALCSLFLALSALPLVNFHAARRASTELLAAGADPVAHSWMSDSTAHVSKGTDVDHWSAIRAQPGPPLPPWLKPLVADKLDLPRDDAVLEITLSNDQQIELACEHASRLAALQSVQLWGTPTPQRLRQFQRSLPSFPRLAAVYINGLTVPPGWYASLKTVRVLYVWDESRVLGGMLSGEDLTDIANLSNVETLMFLGPTVRDADVPVLTQMKSLRRLVLRGTGVTAVGEQALGEALPNCEIVRD